MSYVYFDQVEFSQLSTLKSNISETTQDKILKFHFPLKFENSYLKICSALIVLLKPGYWIHLFL